MENQKYGTDLNFKHKPFIPAMIILTSIHLCGLYGFYLILYSHIATTLWAMFWTFSCIIGLVMGTHRMYAHRSFKPNSKIVRLVLVGLHTLGGQLTVWSWTRVHRLHHKYVDTDGDPHNSSRGFFFSHMGWLMHYAHPAVLSEFRKVDMSDVLADKYVIFQKKNYLQLYISLNLLVSLAPMFLWNETFINCLYVCYFARYTYGMNITFFINSWAHKFGKRPFDNTIIPTQTPLLAILTFGEGGHNYHHSFQWDYRANDCTSRFNVCTRLIELLARFNLVTDLKTATDTMIESRVAKKGDGSHPVFGKRNGKDKFDQLLSESMKRVQ